jgi:hypothetical protein
MTNPHLSPDNNSLLRSIQDRVTSFVLKQIDKQLQQLENNMVTTITEQNTSNTDSKNHHSQKSWVILLMNIHKPNRVM